MSKLKLLSPVGVSHLDSDTRDLYDSAARVEADLKRLLSADPRGFELAQRAFQRALANQCEIESDGPKAG